MRLWVKPREGSNPSLCAKNEPTFLIAGSFLICSHAYTGLMALTKKHLYVILYVGSLCYKITINNGT